MDANTAMKFVTAYGDACTKVLVSEAYITRLKARHAQDIKDLTIELEKLKEERDNFHAFAKSGLAVLTPERGFVV